VANYFVSSATILPSLDIWDWASRKFLGTTLDITITSVRGHASDMAVRSKCNIATDVIITEFSDA
jgi:hypothetical protein